MTVVDVRDIEDCFDGFFVKEVLFSEPITREAIYHLGQGADLQYFPDFPRPFFRVDRPDFVLQGVEGNRTARVTLGKENTAQSLATFERLLEDYQKEKEEQVRPHNINCTSP